MLLSISCDKEGNEIGGTGTKSDLEFIAYPSEIILSSDNASALALTIVWDVAGASSLEFSTSKEFSPKTEIAITPGQNSYQFTTADMSNLMLKLGVNQIRNYIVYVRLVVTTGSGKKFSDSIQLDITPYMESSNWMKIVDITDESKVLAIIYSSDETPDIYEGFAVPNSEWYNCFFIDSDGTKWGCDASWTAFSLISGSTNNCWFAKPAGCQYVYADTGNKEWWHLHVPNINANVGSGSPVQFAYSSTVGGYTGTITTGSSTQFTVTGTGARFDKTTGTDTNTTGISTAFCLEPDGDEKFKFSSKAEATEGFTIESAGTYTITFNVSDCTFNLTKN